MKITCGTFLFDKQGRLLICHPTGHSKQDWSIPKGIHEVGESHLEAATRELFEETNIDLYTMPDRVQGVYELPRVPYAAGHKTLHPFVIVTDVSFARHDIKCTSIAKAIGMPECDEHRWVSLAEAEKLLHETQVKCLPRVKQALKKHRQYETTRRKEVKARI